MIGTNDLHLLDIDDDGILSYQGQSIFPVIENSNSNSPGEWPATTRSVRYRVIEEVVK